MEISIRWHMPVELFDGRSEGLIYACDVDHFPREPGVYVFGRQWGHSRFTPLYIGRTKNLQRRIKQQLEKVRLMTGVRDNVRAGTRQINYCTIETKPGQQIDRVLPIVEQALIEHALTSGFELINIQGVRLPSHSISSVGKKAYHSQFPRRMQQRK